MDPSYSMAFVAPHQPTHSSRTGMTLQDGSFVKEGEVHRSLYSGLSCVPHHHQLIKHKCIGRLGFLFFLQLEKHTPDGGLLVCLLVASVIMLHLAFVAWLMTAHLKDNIFTIFQNWLRPSFSASSPRPLKWRNFLSLCGSHHVNWWMSSAIHMCVYLCVRSLIYGGPLVNIRNLLKSWRTVISHRFWVFWCPHSMSVHWSVGILHVVLKSL